jgi:D-alanyl-D-alanine carboxypeptidase
VPHLPTPTLRFAALGVALLAALPLTAQTAAADATLVVEADSGKVLYAEHATYPWYPASTSKLMTMYLTLKAVKDGRLTLDSLVTVSPVAVSQAPSKMGFAAGTQLTVDNALKMMMVKSANDIAVVLAEAVGGSVEGFADQMNAASRRLGMTQSSWVNPNGLPADEQITSPRDMAILARAILRELPEYEMYWHIPAIKFGRRVMHNTNGLIGRYPDADGMKTGFICASGFNVVATATRGGRKLIVVVFGSTSGAVRSEKAAQLFEKGFSNTGLSWLMPSLGTVDALQPIAAAPPNLRDDMCGPHRKKPASETDEAEATTVQNDKSEGTPMALQSAAPPKFTLAGLPPLPLGEPVEVFIAGSPKKAPAAAKPATAAKPAAAPAQSASAGKPAAAKPAAAKPDAVPNPWGNLSTSTTPSTTPGTTAKPQAAAQAAKPKPQAAKPAAAKPEPKPQAAKPAPKPQAVKPPSQPPA